MLCITGTLWRESTGKPGQCGSLSYIMFIYIYIYICRVRSRNCGCLVTWFYYQMIAKPGNKTAAVPWPEPYVYIALSIPYEGRFVLDYIIKNMSHSYVLQHRGEMIFKRLHYKTFVWKLYQYLDDFLGCSVSVAWHGTLTHWGRDNIAAIS